MFEQPCQQGHLTLNLETLTIKTKPVTISGNPSKPPNDNIKTKLKNNSTPTMQEACGRALTTSQVLSLLCSGTYGIFLTCDVYIFPVNRSLVFSSCDYLEDLFILTCVIGKHLCIYTLGVSNTECLMLIKS